MLADRLFRNARLLPLTAGAEGYRVIENAMIATKNGRITYAGPAIRSLDAPEIIDSAGRLITPGLIDCHTHLVYAGNRAAEFEQRLLGASYEEIARAGGGIASTMRDTRAATKADLVQAALPRLDALLAEGVTTIEIKSGYGQSLESEIKQLRAARALAAHRQITICPTFLGAHVLPPEFADQDSYITELCEKILPVVAAENLADAVDGFCESIAFTPAQIDRFFDAATALGLRVKLHADQLTNLHGAALAATHHALSADHLEFTDEPGIAAMAAAGTVAVILPGAFYYIRESQKPPIEQLRHHGVPMALATDCNPGTSPLTSLLLTMNMAATLFRLTAEECLAGVTRNAAQALGLAHETGTLTAGKSCDLAIWNITHPAELVYPINFKSKLHQRVWKGYLCA